MTNAQREINVEIDGQSYSGRYEVSGFAKGGHTVTVWYRGTKATDTIPPEANHESYTDFLAEKMLERLIREENGTSGSE
jgi:hypothetical protein